MIYFCNMLPGLSDELYAGFLLCGSGYKIQQKQLHASIIQMLPSRERQNNNY